MNLRSLILIFCLTLSAISCGQSLTREAAARIINEKYGYPSPEIEMIDVDFTSVHEAAALGKYQDAGLLKIEDGRLRRPRGEA